MTVTFIEIKRQAFKVPLTHGQLQNIQTQNRGD